MAYSIEKCRPFLCCWIRAISKNLLELVQDKKKLEKKNSVEKSVERKKKLGRRYWEDNEGSFQ